MLSWCGMKFVLDDRVKHLFILGAGASCDYGLPNWSSLSTELEGVLNNSSKEHQEHASSIFDWLSKVGSKYATIDECILHESNASDYHENGHEVEDALFRAIFSVLKGAYVNNAHGWIRHLNDAILDNPGLESQIAFVNYNYDDVLDRNLLAFDHLSGKQRHVNYADRLVEVNGSVIDCLHPHGYLEGVESDFLHKHSDTLKTNKEGFVDAVSCHESKKHQVSISDKRRWNSANKGVVLYILGLGGGLTINLQRLLFSVPVTEIHATDKEGRRRDEILRLFKSKFKIDEQKVHLYDDCVELVKSCFH